MKSDTNPGHDFANGQQERKIAPVDEVMLDLALRQAHLPTLAMSIVHLTGDVSILRGEKPTYKTFDDEHRTQSQEAKARIREAARAAILDYVHGKPLPPAPAAAVIREMMDFIAGQQIPEKYVPFLDDELALDGRDPKMPAWNRSEKRAGEGMKVAIIGAGFSGLLAGLRLRQAGVDFEIFEKNADLGGTWFENTYPGCRVDSTNHMYSYSFDVTGHSWPMWYSTQPVIQSYLRDVADRFDVTRSVRFGTKVMETHFDEARSVWQLTLADGQGNLSRTEVTAVISAVGQLNQPKFPTIAGMDTFKGTSFHSAQWRHDVDLRGKRIAVIGTGASAVQFVPEVAKLAGSMDVYQRTPAWLMPTANYHDEVGEGFQWLLQNVPYYEKWWRFFLFW